MINQSTNIESFLLELTKDIECYYIKQKSLGSFEELNGNLIFSHYRPFNGKITPLLIKQHLNKDITLAIDLKRDDTLLYEYRGDRVYAFGTLFFKLIDKSIIDILQIIKYDDNTLVIYLKFKNSQYIKSFKEKIESSLLLHLEKEWRVYPIKSRPKLGNLMELPREIIEFF